MLIWQCDTVWHSTDTNTATTFSKISVRLWGVWSVVLMMMICVGEMWQQCGRFVHIRYSRYASPPLLYTGWSLIATSIKLGNPNAGGLTSLVSPTHCWYPGTIWQADTLYCTSDWRLAEIYLLLLPRHYQEINVQHRLCSEVWPVIGQIIQRPHLAWQDIT